MNIVDLFSKRQKRLRGEVPDVYSYNDIPQPLRVQILYLLQDGLGDAKRYEEDYSARGTRWSYDQIVGALCREWGLFELSPPARRGAPRNVLSELYQFLLTEMDVDRVLSAVELAMNVLESNAHAAGLAWRDQEESRAKSVI